MMKKKRNLQTQPLLEALRPLDQINTLPPSLSPAQMTARLRQQTPHPAKRRILTLYQIAVAAAVLAIAIGAVALWRCLPYLEIVNRETGDATPLTEVLQDYSKIEAYFKELKNSPADEAIATAENALEALAESPTMKGDMPKADTSAGQTVDATNAPENGVKAGYGKTNTQTAGVDEADILKNDGSCLYFVPAGGKTIQIISPRPADAMKVLSKVAVPQESGKILTVTELYVRENRLIAVCSLTQPDNRREDILTNYAYGGCMITAPASDTRILIYDISDRSAPKLIRTFTQDGGVLSSRMIGDTLYLVTQYTVAKGDDGEFNDYIPTTADGEKEPQKLNATDIQILPGAKTPNYLVVSALDTGDGKKETARKAVLGSGDQVYCSTDALYTASTEYDEDTEYTTIFGFPFTEDGLGKSVSGRVRGHVLNQFSLDSFAGALRIATTETVNGTTSSRITILDRSLKTLSTLANIAPGEEIYAVRFLGAKGYVVTFRQTDPLFVIDLSDTGAPKILGKLKIPGFSSYLHPVGENLLLGIGQDADLKGSTRGVKLSLFDVSNPAKPKETDSLVMPKGTFTDAPSSYKSILFLPERNAVALPVCQEETGKASHPYFDDFYCVFSLQGNQIRLMHTLRNYTKQEQRTKGSGTDFSILRGTYIGDTLYTLSNSRVCAFSLSTGRELGRLDF